MVAAGVRIAPGQRMRFTTTFLFSLATLVGCAADPTTTEDTVELSAPTSLPVPVPSCTPRPPINPALCSSHEPAPPPPPINGKCNVELRVNEVAFSTGQGWLEGRAEASAKFSATDLDTGTVTTGSYPAAGWLKMDVDKKQTANVELGTYEVEKGKHKKVQVCGTFTEFDDLSKDDVGIDCDTITLSCPEGGGNDTLFANLCKGGDCTNLKGAMSANVQIMTADADGDCVANKDDYTPEPCDEALKGQECRASVIYFAYDGSVADDIVQFVGTDLAPAMTGYDRTVLLIDDDQVGPFNLNPAALALADVKMLPTEQNFFATLQDLTARGCDMDIWMFAHGNPDYDWASGGGPISVGGGRVTSMADDDMSMTADITTKELLADTDPAVSGTPSVPVRMSYGTPCFYELWNLAWLTVGAKVTSGATGINFKPNNYDNFVVSWNANASYGASLATEATAAKEAVAFGFIAAEGALPPWLCVGNTVLGQNPCARNFFTDSDAMATADASDNIVDGPDAAKYDIGSQLVGLTGTTYDPTVSGTINMRRSSAKLLNGDPTIKKNMAGGLTWP